MAGETKRRAGAAKGASRNGASAATAAAPKAKPSKRTAPTRCAASLFGPNPLPPAFSEPAQALEKAFGCPVWLLVQTGDGSEAKSLIGPDLYRVFQAARHQLSADGRIVLVLDSPGGYAQSAYQLARLLRRHCGDFAVVIPRYAKSAATLLALGADEIYMAEDAEIGPLDAQLWDMEREERGSALDEVQALERLHSVALEQVDETMMLLQLRTPKKTDTLLPIACRFVSDMMEPLLEKVDTVHYARQSRVLKVAEDYATRLLRPMYGNQAGSIANKLVNGYPEHGFVIDRQEACDLLAIEDSTPEIAAAIDGLEDFLIGNDLTAAGRLKT